MTDTTISRRNLLAAAPVAAIAVAIPASASAQTSDLAGWEQAKANYFAAKASVTAEIDPTDNAQRAMFVFHKTAPTERITYTAKGFTSRNGLVTMLPSEVTETLTTQNFRNHAGELTGNPAYDAFCARVEAWENDPAHLAAKAEERRADAAFRAACDGESEAWSALVAFPLSDAASMADKIAVATPFIDGEGDIAMKLIEGLQADLARMAA